MAGPGIRYKNLAAQISKVAEVQLAVFSNTPSASGEAISVGVRSGDFESIFDQYDVVFAQWLSGDMLQYAHRTGKTIIIDLYAPVPIEYLASLGFSNKRLSGENDAEFSGILETYKQYLAYGDLFTCSNERQMDFWTGFMTSTNVIRPSNFLEKSQLQRIILCPMGISDTKATARKLKLRTQLKLGKDDFVLLWTGGIWDWFDAQLVIKAINRLNNPKVKLVFMGMQHPNSNISEMSESKSARKLSDKLGLTGKSVFFIDGWIEYEDRTSYLLDADAAIYADKESLETRFSHRTRVLDHIWAGIPTICSSGDYLADLIEKEGFGVTASRTPRAFSQSIRALLENPKKVAEIKDNIRDKRAKYTWDVLSGDLLSFIESSEPNQLVNTAEPSITSPTSSRTRRMARRTINSLRVLLGRADVR